MHIHVAHFALVALVEYSVEQRAAMVTEGGRGVGVHLEMVTSARVVLANARRGSTRQALVDARTTEGHKLMATLVHHVGTDLVEHEDICQLLAN